MQQLVCVVPFQGNPREAQCSRFDYGLLSQAPSAWHVPSSILSKRKQQTPHCFHSPATVSPHSSVREGVTSLWELNTSQVPEASQGPTLQEGLSKNSSPCSATIFFTQETNERGVCYPRDGKWKPETSRQIRMWVI